MLTAAIRARFSFLGTADDVEAMSSEIIRWARLRAIDVEESALVEGGYERYAITLAVAALEEQE